MFACLQILGTGMSTKMWEVTVEHARTCTIDKRIYMYCPPGSQQKSGVVFNIVGQLMGLFSECQYIHVDKLSEPEKVYFFSLHICLFFSFVFVFGFSFLAITYFDEIYIRLMPLT